MAFTGVTKTKVFYKDKIKLDTKDLKIQNQAGQTENNQSILRGKNVWRREKEMVKNNHVPSMTFAPWNKTPKLSKVDKLRLIATSNLQ